MVAYSFNPRFAEAIRQGYKRQTIRGLRKNHAQPGQMLQLFTGMRTAHCKRIVDDVPCTCVMAIVITFTPGMSIDSILTDGIPVRDLDAFAVRDGFEDAVDMADFWKAMHGPMATFVGVVIEWAAPREPEFGVAT